MLRILILGLPGAGKTTLAKALQSELDAKWFNADEVRKKFNDWDFSETGRIRQSIRMRELCDSSDREYNIVDFVCPLPEMRKIFDADWIIWVDTIQKGRYEDTNKAFIPPEEYDFRVTEQNAEKWAKIIGTHILTNCKRPVANMPNETVQNVPKAK
jgi:adenylylsulfate kinase